MQGGHDLQHTFVKASHHLDLLVGPRKLLGAMTYIPLHSFLRASHCAGLRQVFEKVGCAANLRKLGLEESVGPRGKGHRLWSQAAGLNPVSASRMILGKLLNVSRP